MGQPQVQVVVGGQRLDQLDLGEGQPGVSEQRQPLRQVDRRFPKARNGVPLPHVRRVGRHAAGQRPPQRRLPGEVARQVGAVAVEPVDEQLRPLARIRREQARDAARDRVAPPQPQLPFLVARLEAAEMGGQRPAPVLVEALVDHLEQRPDHGVGRPRVVVGGAGDFGDQRAWVPELDARAHPVRARTATEDVRQPLAEPPLDAARGNQDQLRGERVGERLREERAETVGQKIRSFSAVQMQGHQWPP